MMAHARSDQGWPNYVIKLQYIGGDTCSPVKTYDLAKDCPDTIVDYIFTCSRGSVFFEIDTEHR